MSDHLLEVIDRGIATLTMNRPEARNALSPSMMAGLEEAMPRLASDPKVRVVVLTGAGGAFCAGGAVKGFAGANAKAAQRPSFEDRVEGLRSSTELVQHLHEMPKPTIAVISGPAAGGGLSFALACDIRIAVETAKLTTAFSKIAVSGDYGGSYFLTQLVGTAKARELYFSADIILAPEALQLGMLNQVYPEAEFEQKAKAYVERLAALPPIAIEYMKKNLNKALDGSLADVLDLEADHMTRTFDTLDHRNAAKAFVEKRLPEFDGR